MSQSNRMVACMALALLLAPAFAQANVGPITYGGQLTSEPIGVEGIDIVRETLNIDARPLAKNELVRVEAVYRLNNRRAEKKLDLVFASGSAGVAEFEVRLGDKVIPSTPSPDLPVPDSWKAPQHTPALDGGRPLEYLRFQSKKVTPITFTVVVPPGEQTLTVRYAAETGRHHEGKPTDFHQFAYVLAPARTWAAFGGLDLTIQLPEGWRAAATPELKREGDTLSAAFAGLPGDTIELTVQYPAGASYQRLKKLADILWPVALFGGAGLCVLGGILTGRRGGWRRWLASIAFPILWGAAILGSGFFSIFGPNSTLPAEQVNTYGYEKLFGIIGTVFLAFIAVPVGMGVTQLIAKIVHSIFGPKATERKG